MKKVCICGGGALGHVIAGYLSARGKADVSILTNHPSDWQHEITIFTPDNIHNEFIGKIDCISSDPKEVLADAEVVLLCLPGFLIKKELLKIKDYLKKGAYLGSVFSSTGFFFEAMEILDDKIPLWGFQRVPFISRVNSYGCSANLLGYKKSHHIAIERDSEENKELFRQWVEFAFERPTLLLNNYLEASLTNSNPILHTSRLYTMFIDWRPGKYYPHNILFYEEWTDNAADMLIQMDAEFFKLLSVLPVTPDYLPTILNYYESIDARTLANKLSSISSFQGILSPMKEEPAGWVPDFSSRYFIEDFEFGLKYIWQLAHKCNISVPNIDKVYTWGCWAVSQNR